MAASSLIDQSPECTLDSSSIHSPEGSEPFFSLNGAMSYGSMPEVPAGAGHRYDLTLTRGFAERDINCGLSVSELHNRIPSTEEGDSSRNAVRNDQTLSELVLPQGESKNSKLSYNSFLKFLDGEEAGFFSSQGDHEDEVHRWDEENRDGCTGGFDGHVIVTNPGVFPAEKGDTSRDIALAIRELQHCHERIGTEGNRSALDMGCGNGALGISLATLSSFERVVAIDNHIPAVDNARENVTRCFSENKMEVILSDLMRDVPRERVVNGVTQDVKFDLIVFNHPYYPREGAPKLGLGSDGGNRIIRRFFEEISDFSHDETEILMPFATSVDPRHDPSVIAREFGYSVSVLRERIDADGVSHRVFRFVREDIFDGNLPAVVVRENYRGNSGDGLLLAA